MTPEERIKQLEVALEEIKNRSDAGEGIVNVANKALHPEGQLYVCQYTLTYYTLANSIKEARQILRDALATESHHYGDVVAKLVQPGHVPGSKWTTESYVYGATNVTLGSVLSKLKAP